MIDGLALLKLMNPEVPEHPRISCQPLTPCPLPTKDGWMLRTIGDAGEYILALPQKRGRLAHWEQVRRLLMKETSVATVAHQVHLALSKDEKLDVFAFQSIARARRWRGAPEVEED
jgi:hypothetical protein